MRSLVLAAFAAATLTTVAFGSPAALSERAIRQPVIGNTLTGYDEDDEYFTEYLHPNGTLGGVGQTGKYKGQWSIKFGMLCIDVADNSAGDDEYYIDDDAEYYDDVADCWKVVAQDKTLQFMQSLHGGGNQFDAVLVPGNPDGL